MKKLMFIMVLALLAVPCFADYSPLDAGGSFEFGYLSEWDSNIVAVDMALYVNPEGQLGGAIFGGIEALMDPNNISYFPSEVPYTDRYMLGGVLNYSILYVSAQYYRIYPSWNWEETYFIRGYTEKQIKLSAGIQYNMPYEIGRINYPFDVGLDFSIGYLMEPGDYFSNLDVALYIRPGKMLNAVVYGGVEVLWALNYYEIAGYPFSDRYSIGVALNFSIISFRVEHYCIHPVLSDPEQLINKRTYSEDMTKFSVGLYYNMPFKVKRRGR